MFKVAAVAAGLHLLAVGGAAAQSFNDFGRFCIGTDADPEAIQAAALGAGWRVLPAEMVAQPGEDGETVLAGYYAPEGAVGFLLLSEGDAPLDIETSARSRSCIMVTETVTLDSARARLKAYLSVGDMIEQEIDEGFWLFSRSEDGFRDERALLEPDAQDLTEAARQRALRYAGTSEPERGTVMLIYGRLVAENDE